MKMDTAARLTELALQMSDDLNGMVRAIQATEPDDESVRLQQALGRIMWTIYFEMLQPALEEHPSLESEAGTRPPAQPARPPAPRSRPPSQRQRSGRPLR